MVDTDTPIEKKEENNEINVKKENIKKQGGGGGWGSGDSRLRHKVPHDQIRHME